MATGSLSAGSRRYAARKGWALPDGSFPIRNETELKDAIAAIGRAKNYVIARAHIIKRARALHLVRLLPPDWNIK